MTQKALFQEIISWGEEYKTTGRLSQKWERLEVLEKECKRMLKGKPSKGKRDVLQHIISWANTGSIFFDELNEMTNKSHQILGG